MVPHSSTPHLFKYEAVGRWLKPPTGISTPSQAHASVEKSAPQQAEMVAPGGITVSHVVNEVAIGGRPSKTRSRTATGLVAGSELCELARHELGTQSRAWR